MQKLLFFGSLFTIVLNSFGQQDVSLKSILPPSPEASSIVKYGNYQVGTYTGKPDISIPIYEIKTSKLSVPITLTYDATGIRVNEISSWVGMNWSLDAGGILSQVVVGEPDVLSTGLDGVPPRYSDIVDNTTYLNYLRALVDGDIMAPAHPDAEPDKFYYSFGGKSGSFVFDRNRNILQIPKTSVKISPIDGSITNGFRITDESGTTYVFTNFETTESYIYNAAGQYPDAKNNPIGSSYKIQKTAYYLSEIISNDRIDHIYFAYENEVTGAKDENYSETWGPKYNNGNQFPTYPYREFRWNGSTRVITIPRLKTITFNNGKVEFSRVYGRLDDAGSSSRLEEIFIYSKNSDNSFTKVKSYQFIHGYYYNGEAYAQNSGFPNQACDRYRLRLDEIKLKDSQGNQISRYSFSYNNTNLPPKTSCAQDWGGYYNGQTSNATLVPTTNVLHPNGSWVTIGGANKVSDETYMKAGILEKIIFPTGGYTIFEMESHKKFEQYSIVSEGHNANAVGMSANNLVVQTFTAPAIVPAGTGRINLSIGPYSSGDTPPFVKIKNLTTGQEQTFTSSDISSFYNYNTTYEIVSGNSYELTASCYVNQSYAMANINVFYSKQISDPHLESVSGLRIKSIKNYRIDNVLANEENYRYGGSENGGGVVTGLSTQTYSYGRNQQIYYGVNGSACNIIYGGLYQVFLGGSLYDQALVGGSSTVYTEVTKYYGNTSANAGKTKYYYEPGLLQIATTQPLPGSNYAANNQGILVINNSWKKGKLQQQEEYRRNDNGSYDRIQLLENFYDTADVESTYGLIAQLKYDRVLLPGGDICHGLKYFWEYAYAEYPINTGYMQLNQTKRTDFVPGTSSNLETIQNFTYDNIRKDILTKTVTTNSKLETIESEKKFPFHKTQLVSTITSLESTALDSMLSRNMIFPVEEIQRNNGTQTMLKKTSFEFVNGPVIAPVNLRYQVANNPIETRVQFPKYDNIGNLIEQSKSNDVLKSYLWGYRGAYPVAEATNAKSNEIFFSDFEENSGWDGYLTGYDQTKSHSGKYSGRIDKSSPGEQVCLSTKPILIQLTNTKRFKYSGWVYSNGPGVRIFLFMSIPGETNNWTSNDHIDPVGINKWVYFEKEFDVPKEIVKLNLRIDNWGGGTVWYDDLRICPSDAQMSTYTYDPLIGVTSQSDINNNTIYYEYDNFGRLKLIKDKDGNVIKTMEYQYKH